ncbi:SPOR domain-containing protein [Aquabacterium lacunae]|uniref:SPOR domain-containing protein n=1 Tax=Aquabacterium lacunae TaxID=2528630 RepID=A0A4Q9H2M9_9BURK|nr:SPOR domain-containing protein [Aquabacterium lacunae]TBO32861.1 SPOR domain-containing protein [Aquabacterium lacunae]
MPLPQFLQRFRPGASEPEAPVQPLSEADIEQARVKARRRMVGMAVLVAAGVVGFPWLFETQPRPLNGDVQVVSQVSPGVAAPVSVLPRPPVASAAATRMPTESPNLASEPASTPQGTIDAIEPPAPRAASMQGQGASEVAPAPRQNALISAAEPQAQQAREVAAKEAAAKEAAAKEAAAREAAARASAEAKAKAEAKSRAEAKARAEARAEAKAKEEKAREAKAREDKAKAEAKAKADSKAKAEKDKAEKDKAAKDGKAADTDTRYVVQVGAFNDAAAAQAVRQKVEKLGIKTYAQVIDSPQGKKTRVRVGPFTSKAEAEKALAKLKQAGLNAGVLTL